MVGSKKNTWFDYLNYILLAGLCVLTVYPVLYVLFSSVSDPLLLSQQTGIMLKPLGFSLDGYELVLSNPNIITGYRNTIIYVVLGTSINMFMSILGAYALSRRDLYIGKGVMIMIIFTMHFGGGLIPTYIVVSGILGQSIWTQVVPGAIAAANLIILKTGFQSIPESLIESARIDGAGDFKILTGIVLPLSKPVLAVISLYYGVAHWNKWLSAVIYLRDRSLFPLQLFLREILIQNSTDEFTAGTDFIYDMAEVVKYSTIIVAIVPVLCVYPFLQKYFVKGVMMGAVKG